MEYREYDYCMRRKCKDCKIDGGCKMLDESLHWRLMWHPFENLKEIMEKKHERN